MGETLFSFSFCYKNMNKNRLAVSVKDGVSSIGSIIDGVEFVFALKLVSLVILAVYFSHLFRFAISLQ